MSSDISLNSSIAVSYSDSVAESVKFNHRLTRCKSVELARWQ